MIELQQTVLKGEQRGLYNLPVTGNTVITCVEGAGKALVAIKRAEFLAHYDGHALLATFRRNDVTDFGQLCSSQANITRRTLASLIYQQLIDYLNAGVLDRRYEKTLSWNKQFTYAENDMAVQAVLAQAVQAVFGMVSSSQLSAFSRLFEEIRRFEIRSEETFLKHCSGEPEKVIRYWQAFQRYQVLLEDAFLLDWYGRVEMADVLCAKRPLPYPIRHLVIYDAHDLSAAYLRVLRKMVIPEGSLTLVGDAIIPGHSPFSWEMANSFLENVTTLALIRDHRELSQRLAS